MSQASSYRELALHRQLVKLESELKTVKTQQNYSTGNITSVVTEWINIDSYKAPNDALFPGHTVYEVAAIFNFVGSLKDKVAIGLIETSTSTDSGTSMIWQAFMPTNSINKLKFGVVFRMGNSGGKRLGVRLHTNMTGSFSLEKTYGVPIT